ncbi:MAG: uroporphyrinogen decarboxylase family protein [Lachnospiraceae bacterium]|nr:uroporphyrinogen decarboxylase family protein [Lachnospiraceae bacterium]
MTNRENFLSLIRRKGYERVPVEFVLCPSLEQQIKDQLGTEDYEEYFGFPWRRVEDIRLKDHDVNQYRQYFDPPLAEGADIDQWGIGHEKSPNSMHMTYMRHPLEHAETLEELQAYPFPDFAAGDNSHQKKQVEDIKSRDLIALGDMQMTIWEVAWYIRGMEELFCDMMTDDEMAEFMLDKALEMAKIRAKSYVEAGVDVLFVGDDIGMQHTIMMSEALYCKWIKPRLKELISFAKAINPDVLVFYHSCGFIEPFIPHLIDAGVDVLNPIQSECMDFKEICARYGDQISFHGTIGTQTVMPQGTPEEVKAAVWENLDAAGEMGGLMVAPTHMLEPEVPVENVLAYVEACREYHTEKK